ncbi:MAG: hypothetical protein Q7V63_06075 [Gammaproteobacteria bacterium]|nr:hypothetical protein [Gammaproteobacteria bacterium]
MQGFKLTPRSETTPEAFIKQNRRENGTQPVYEYCVAESLKDRHKLVKVGLRKFDDSLLEFWVTIHTKVQDELDEFRDFFTSYDFDVKYSKSDNLCEAYFITSLADDKILFFDCVKIFNKESLPFDLIRNLKLASGCPIYSYSVEDLADCYRQSNEKALKYVQDSDETDKCRFALGYLAQHGYLQETDSTVATAGAGASDAAYKIDLNFALDCYYQIPESSDFYKQAQFEIASIILVHVAEYEGTARENMLKSLMDSATKSDDMRLICQSMTVCAGKGIDSALSATSIGDLLYQLSVALRAPEPAVTVSAGVVTPLRVAMSETVSALESRFPPSRE